MTTRKADLTACRTTTDDTTSRYGPGDHLEHPWLDAACDLLGTDFFTTTDQPSDPDQDLWIHCLLPQHLIHARPVEIVTFKLADLATTVRIDTHETESQA